MRPSRWNLLWPYLNLLAQNLIPDLFSVSSIVRPSPQHQLVGDDSNCIIVNWKRVILPTHNLRCHIAWSTTSIGIIIGLDDSCNSEICDSDISLIIKDQILWLYITMYYIVQMEKLQSDQNASNKEFRLVLFKSSSTAHVIAEISSNKKIHYQI